MSDLIIETPRVFLPLLEPARYKGAHGGRGSGKSHFFGESVIERSAMEKTDIVCVREKQKSLQQSVKKLLESKIQTMNAGYYFDVRHAVAEGGDAGWRTAFHLAAPRLAMVALKDFYWEKAPSGWRIRNCPIGEGMVNWKAFFTMLAQAGFHGPVSLHLEYDVPGDTPETKEQSTLAAAARDLAFVKAGLAEAYR